MNATGGEFLLADLDVALTLTGTAETTQNKEHAQRNHQNARTTYDTVLRLLPTLQLEVAQRNEIDKKLAALKARLMAAGKDSRHSNPALRTAPIELKNSARSQRALGLQLAAPIFQSDSRQLMVNRAKTWRRAIHFRQRSMTLSGMLPQQLTIAAQTSRFDHRGAQLLHGAAHISRLSNNNAHLTNGASQRFGQEQIITIIH